MGRTPANIKQFIEAGKPNLAMLQQQRREQTHCKSGHKFTEKNTRISKKPNGTLYRQCKECARIREANRRNRNNGHSHSD